jgi:hypothetical protein
MEYRRKCDHESINDGVGAISWEKKKIRRTKSESAYWCDIFSSSDKFLMDVFW